LCLDSNDSETVKCAFKKRLLRDLPPAIDHFYNDFAVFVKKFVVTNFHTIQPMSFEEWLESTTYNDARKLELRTAFDSLRGSRPSKRQCSHVDSFVKGESYMQWKHARMINSRCDAFKVWSGPFFKALEEMVYQLPYFIKHTPVPDRPALISSLKQAGQRYFATDYTAFESHFTPDLLHSCECILYEYCFPGPDGLLLSKVISGDNHMRTRSGVHAKVTGRRMSGDMCTSLGNGFTNLMLALYIAHKKNGNISGFVEGDDGIFACDFELNAQDYLDCGFTIKIEEVNDPCEASFCGMVFTESGEIIKDPRKFVQNFGWTQSFLSAGPRIMDELLRAKALSSIYETPQCPVVGAIARYALKVTQGVTPRFVDDGYHVVPVTDPGAYHPSIDTRVLFEKLYHVSIDSQLRIEYLASIGDFDAISIIMPPIIISDGNLDRINSDMVEYTSKYIVAS
jgi:hypothetical protein